MHARQGVDPGNAELARTFERVAELLELQSANPWRVHAWRHAADVLREHPTPVAALVRELGADALRDQGLGHALGSALRELVERGRLGLLERLEAELPPVERLMRLGGLGRALATRLHQQLHVETLEDLEIAAHDGSLERVDGFGPRRAELVRQQLAGLLARRPPAGRARAPGVRHPAPPVEQLLEVDAEYRRRAREGSLPKIAPRRFNPRHEQWLPVLHARRGDLHFHALFSNTARAHQLGKTRDWVVLYWGEDGRENQCTVVTEVRGPLQGLRVVRGREAECRRRHEADADTLPLF